MYRHIYIYKIADERFLLIDTGPESTPNWILVFGREANLENLEDVTNLHVYVDGTFRLAPLIFKQIYVVLAERNGYVFSLLYCLLVNKQRRTYERLFTLIPTTWPALGVRMELGLIILCLM